jgi:hypothetical protein
LPAERLKFKNTNNGFQKMENKRAKMDKLNPKEKLRVAFEELKGLSQINVEDFKSSAENMQDVDMDIQATGPNYDSQLTSKDIDQDKSIDEVTVHGTPKRGSINTQE